jgi:hypothetical protein
MDVPARFRPALAAVVERLAAGDYQGLKRDGIHPYPNADLCLWIRNYGLTGATIVPLPEEAWASAEAIPITGEPGHWGIVLDLWTQEEGKSDLSMEATIVESPDGISVVINDLHVL